MGRKRIASDSGVRATKKVRRPLTVAQKLDIIARLEKGERSKDICADMDLTSSTVRTIYLQKDKLKKVAETYVGGEKLERIVTTRDAIMEKLERLLTYWIDSHNQRNINLNFLVIHEKALSLFEDLKQKAEEEGASGMKNLEFKASRGWFERFKNRANLPSLGTSDIEAAKVFPKELQKIVEEGGYSPKQIFNINETGLFWKKLPSRTFISRDENKASGFKVSKDRLTLLIGGNLEGDVKLKLLLVYHSQNPRALKGLNKAALPVIWRSNKKACITIALFADYVTGYLSPFITSYCAKHNLDNKALLIIDNAPGNPVNVEDYADNIQVVFLPPYSSNVLQPMDQGITAIFKAYYLQLVMRYLILGSDGENKPTIKQLWKDYNIKFAVDNIDAAWNKVTQKCLNNVWRTLLPKYVHDFESSDKILERIQHKIVELALEAGFEEVDQTDVQEMLASHSEKLTNEELMQLDEERPKEDDEDDGCGEMKTLDTKSLSLLFTTCEKAIQIVEENDPQMERSSAFKRKVNDAIACYRELYKTKTSISSLFRPKQSDEAQPSTSAEPQQSTPEMLVCTPAIFLFPEES